MAHIITPVSRHQRRAPHQRPVFSLLRITEAAELRLFLAQARGNSASLPQASKASLGRGAKSRISRRPSLASRKIEEMIDSGADQDNSRHAMSNAAQLLAHAQHLGKPGVGKLERKARNHQDDKAGQQNQVLPALVYAHARHHGILHRAPRCRLAPPDDRVMQEHRADHDEDQNQIEPSHPAHGNRADVLGMDDHPQMHLGQRKLLRNSLVAFAAGRVEVGVIDGRARIARRQNVMHAVATGAVGRHHRAALGGQSVITVQVSRHAVSRHAELLR